MPDRPRNVGASVRQRLLNLAHARDQPMDLLLTRYALARLLHRLSLSPDRERFVLRGHAADHLVRRAASSDARCGPNIGRSLQPREGQLSPRAVSRGDRARESFQ